MIYDLDENTLMLLTSSCSYRRTFDEFSDIITAQTPVQNIHVGEPGRSNHWIANSTIYALEQLKHKDRSKVCVIVSWSSVDRRDLIVDKVSNEFHKTIDFEEYAKKEFFTGHFGFRYYKWYQDLHVQTYDKDKKSGLLSITNVAGNQPDSKFAIEEFVGKYTKYVYSHIHQFETTLASILSLQSYCKLNNIRLINISWQDIWHCTEDVHGTYLSGQQVHGTMAHENNAVILDYSVLEKRIDRHPQFKYLYDQIDFSSWAFYNTGDCATGGVADWAIRHNGDSVKYFGGAAMYQTELLDPYHPTPAGYHGFAAEVLYPHFMAKHQDLLS